MCLTRIFAVDAVVVVVVVVLVLCDWINIWRSYWCICCLYLVGKRDFLSFAQQDIHNELDKSPNLCSGHPMTRYLVKIEQFTENNWGVISQKEDNACTYCKSLESIYVHIYTDIHIYIYIYLQAWKNVVGSISFFSSH